MVRCSVGAVTVLSLVMVMAPPVAEETVAGETLDLSLPATEGPHPTPPMTLSLGTLGVRSGAGDPYRVERSDAQNYFEIPSERSAASAPGFLVRIPLGDGSR